jgi:hypothetical protein
MAGVDNNGGEWLPKACVDLGLVNQLMMCFVQEPKCLLDCFPGNGNSQEWFRIPKYLDFMDCSEFEEPACAITECIYCNDCVDIINDLYRCVVNEKETVDKRMKPLVDCPLDCSGGSFFLEPAVNATDINVTDSFLN